MVLAVALLAMTITLGCGSGGGVIEQPDTTPAEQEAQFADYEAEMEADAMETGKNAQK